jgi:CDGSH-type Zn-finger protein
MNEPTPLRCYEGNDGPGEPVPAANTATVTASGPFRFRGDLALVALDGAVQMAATRMTLCRCGASGNKPFCDDSHARIGFTDPGTIRGGRSSVEAGAEAHQVGRLALRLNPNGPLVCTGPLTLSGADGSAARDVTTFLCRCGGSQNKPYCDGTHKRIGFTG